MIHYLVAINAKYIHSNLAVYSLKACCKEYKDVVQIGEYTINNQSDYILEQVYKARPDVLYFSCYIWNIDYVLEIAREFHKISPDVPIWVGGPEVSYEVDDFLNKNEFITGVMIGEGERTFYEVVRYYEMLETASLQLKDIKGIAYRDDRDIIFTGYREILDMNQLSFAYDKTEDFDNRIIYYESSRGCPFSCSYCLSSVDKKLRFRDVETVQEELKFFIDKKVPQIKFVDRTFNCWHEHAMAIWQFIKENDNGVTNFHFEISADLINDEELKLISDMRPGLIQLEIGVQSTNEVTIQEIHRTMKLERLKEVVRAIQKNGNIHEHLDLIAGLPYEDYATFKRSFDEIYELKPNQLQLGFLKVLKGSYMYEHAGEYGIVYHDHAPYEVLSTKWISYDDVLKIKQIEETLEVYYNSGQYEVTVKVMEMFFGSAFEMYQRLGEFYERKEYFGMSHSRLRRAQILLEFMEDCFDRGEVAGSWADYKNLFEEATLFDLYYREKCKSRPEWAPDPVAWKSLTRRYAENGKMSHLEPFHYSFPDKRTRTLDRIPVRSEEEIWVLFDYENRDPLDHQARVEIVTV